MRRQLGEELLRVLGAQEDGKARFRLLLLLLGQQRDRAADDGGALVALAGPAPVVEQQAVEAALVVGLGEQGAHQPEEARLDAGRHVEVDPGLLRQRLGLGLVLVGQMGGRQQAKADGGAGLGVGEEGLDVARARRCALNSASSARWVSRLRSGQSGLASRKARISAAVPNPPRCRYQLTSLRAAGSASLVAQGLGVLHPAARRCGDRLAQPARLPRAARGDIADRGDRRIVAGDVLGLLGQRLGSGRPAGPWRPPAGQPSWRSPRPSPRPSAWAWRRASSSAPSRSWRTTSWPAPAPSSGRRSNVAPPAIEHASRAVEEFANGSHHVQSDDRVVVC